MNVKKTIARMIPAFKVAVKKVSQSFPTIPSEFSDNFLVSDSILLSLARLITPGLSSLFPLLAASIVDPPLSGAASSGGDGCQ